MSIDRWPAEEGQAYLYETINTPGQPGISDHFTQIYCDLIL